MVEIVRMLESERFLELDKILKSEKFVEFGIEFYVESERLVKFGWILGSEKFAEFSQIFESERFLKIWILNKLIFHHKAPMSVNYLSSGLKFVRS